MGNVEYEKGFVEGVYLAIDIVKGDTSYSHHVIAEELFKLLTPYQRDIYNGKSQPPCIEKGMDDDTACS